MCVCVCLCNTQVYIPSVEDPVSKLEHMGKETVKKLADLATAAQQAGIEIRIPENCVTKVSRLCVCVCEITTQRSV